MRKILFLFVLMPVILMGQEIKFMGLNIDCDIDTFTKQLKAKGLRQTIDRFEKRIFMGDFATYKNCKIVVTSTEVSKQVKSVEVMFDDLDGQEKEFERNRAYENILLQFKNKYENVIRRTDDTIFKLFGITEYQVVKNNTEVVIGKYDNIESMSILYWNLKQKNNKEISPQKYSNDI